MSGTTNKIPNSDIIGYEGPVGHEKAIHKWQFEGVDVPWRKGKKKWRPEDDPNWVRIGPGKWKYIPKETRKTGRKSAED